MTQHAKLSASGAHKWMNCPGSVVLEAQIPDTGSEYAAAGTLAHAIGEFKLRNHFLVSGKGAKARKSQIEAFKADPLYRPEMEDDTDTYLEYVKEVALGFKFAPAVMLETRVDFGDWVPGGFGTADCILIGDNQIHIIDYKNGTSPVDAEDNPQLMLYALGAYVLFGFIHSFDFVVLHIVQPNKKSGYPITSHSLTLDLLLSWGDWVKERAALANSGTEETCPGAWCESGFCRARSRCRARTVFATEGYDAVCGALPPLLTDMEVGDLLKKSGEIVKWAKALEDYALAAILSGNQIPGWKAVEGTSRRKVADEETLVKHLKASGYDEAILYKRSLESFDSLTKALGGKKTFESLVGPYLIKPPGAPTLAPETDKRDPYSPQTNATDAFK